MLTTYDGDEDIHKALEAGAQAYLLKGMSHTEVTDAIRRVHAGLQVHPGDRLARSWRSARRSRTLSPRELEVLELIAKGLSNREIGERPRHHRGHRQVARQHHPQSARRRRPHGGHRGGPAAWHHAPALSGVLQSGRRLAHALARRDRAGPGAAAGRPLRPLSGARERRRRSAVTYSHRVWQSADGLPEDLAQAVAETPDGYLWIGTSGGLVRFDGVRFTVFNHENEPAFVDDSVYSLLRDEGRDALGRARRAGA